MNFDGAKSGSTYNKTLDGDDQAYSEISLLSYIEKDHVLYVLANEVAKEADLPVNTVLIAGLSVFSSIACRKYCVNYESGGTLPIGLYSVLEQPSGTGKSRALKVFQKPLKAIQKRVQVRVMQRIAELNEKMANENTNEANQ
jgi:Protein of unknown function (DUF3987)